MPNLVTVLEATEEHHNYIKGTWLQSFYFSNGHLCQEVWPETYYKNHRQLVELALKVGKTLVAQSIETPEVTVGWVCYEPDFIHYLYTRHSFRRFGVGKKLFEATGITSRAFNYTHRTKDCEWMIGKTERIEKENKDTKRLYSRGKYPEAIYDPYYFIRRSL